MGKGFALCAGKEHQVLRSPPFNSQFSFLHDNKGQVFIRYNADIGLKTNKGGIKHRKLKPKEVDLYPIENPERYPVRVILMYLRKLPSDHTCCSFYLQPRKKFTEVSWYQNRPYGVNKLCDVIKETCKTAKLPGFYTNHSLRSTSATKMYRSNMDEQIITEITGHCSTAVRSYKRTSNGQHKLASNCLFQIKN